MTPWQALGVGQDIAVADLRRRYAALIKEFRPETHPQDFARIREAYEVALPFARRREAEQEEARTSGEAATAEPEDHLADTAAAVSAPDERAAAPGETIAAEVVAAPSAAQAPAAADEPTGLAAHFRRFHALAGSATGSDDEIHLPQLRALLRARTLATLDDSQALEFALMRWFVESASPPLTLLFEAGRAFDWHGHVVRLSSWLSPWALRQMEARLALSRDLVHARHFSGNAWLRRLHSPHAGIGAIVFRPAALEATHWAARWRRVAGDADAPALAACLNARALRRMRGPASTDLLAGLAVAAVAPDLRSAAVWGLVAAAIAFGARQGLHVIEGLPERHRARRFARAVVDHRVAAGVIVALAGSLGVLVLTGSDPEPAAVALAVVLIAPAVLLGTALVWRVAAWVELLAAWPFLWREAVDRLEFDRCVASRAMPEGGRPFGPRLDFAQRLRAIRAALRLQAKEIALRERPPRGRPFKLVRIADVAGKPNRWRFLWFCAWVAFAILRMLHAIGGAH